MARLDANNAAGIARLSKQLGIHQCLLEARLLDLAIRDCDSAIANDCEPLVPAAGDDFDCTDAMNGLPVEAWGGTGITPQRLALLIHETTTLKQTA